MQVKYDKIIGKKSLLFLFSLTLVTLFNYCSVYKSPVNFENKGIVKILVADSRKGIVLHEVSGADTISLFVTALNVNENLEFETDTTYRVLMIKQAKEAEIYDTIKLYFSAKGDEFSYYNIRKNPYGKVLSKGTEYFRVTKPLMGFLLGTGAKK